MALGGNLLQPGGVGGAVLGAYQFLGNVQNNVSSNFLIRYVTGNEFQQYFNVTPDYVRDKLFRVLFPFLVRVRAGTPSSAYAMPRVALLGCRCCSVESIVAHGCACACGGHSYGCDKIMWVMHLQVLGYEFHVLPEHFLLHRTHPPRSWRHTNMDEMLLYKYRMYLQVSYFS